MSITKYKTNYSKDKIERVEVLRETDACVFVPATGWQKGGKTERREAKRGEFASYFDSWTEAHAYLMQNAQSQVETARHRLERARGYLGNIKGMKPPKDAP